MSDSTTAATRRPLSKKLRFEIFKRDSFTCQYCGRKAPDVILHVDHIEPVEKGGTADLLNLITSCADCNLGKSNNRLSDSAVVERQREQLAKLQERKEQIEMMFQWQQGLLDLDAQTIELLGNLWTEQTGYHLNDRGQSTAKKWVKRFGLEAVIAAIHIATEQYDLSTDKAVEYAWHKVGGICAVRQREGDNPDTRRLFYIRGILRNRFAYLNEWKAMEYMREALECGVVMDELEDLAKLAKCWSDWRDSITQWIDETDEGSTDGA